MLEGQWNSVNYINYNGAFTFFCSHPLDLGFHFGDAKRCFTIRRPGYWV